MQPNWTSVSSIFSASESSQTVSGSDARNARSSLDAIFGIQNTKKSEVLPSTSACIIKAGLNKVWRRPRATEPVLASHAHAHASVPRSGVPPVPLQNAPNEEQPRQSIVHTLPTPLLSPQTSFTPANPRHPSGSRFLSFSLQNTAEPEASRTFGFIPQPPVPQIFRSSAARGSESPQRGVGLRPDSFYLPISPPYTTQQFLSNLPDTPIEQSLLFLPPNPPPRREVAFNPFSPEEETVPLPPASEPLNHQLVRGPDDEFPINILSSPLPPNQVPYLSPSPTAILSPLPIAWLLPPRPASNVLNIKIAGPEGYLNADEPHITHFLLSRANKVANSLIMVWQQSHVDDSSARGMMSLKALFAKLNETVLGSDRVALSSFSKLSITIPDLVKDVIPCDELLQSFKDDDSVDLANALDLLEFTWRGDFAVLGLRFNHLPMAHLTVLNVNSTHISFNDALQLLHSCPNVGAVNLGTIQNVHVCDFGDLRKPSEIPHMTFGNLWSLTLESNIALHSFFERIGWFSLVSLVLTLRQDAVVDLHTLPFAWESCRDITFNSHLTPHALTRLRNEYPRLRYNDIGSQ